MSIQPIQFKSYADFLAYLPAAEKQIVVALDELVMECIPNANQKLSYNVPYYSLKKRICFIWPASVPWGKVKLNGVQFGFCTGYLLNNELEFLDRGTRKEVYTKTYFSVAEIEKDRDLLRHFLFEAVKVDSL